MKNDILTTHLLWLIKCGQEKEAVQLIEDYYDDINVNCQNNGISLIFEVINKKMPNLFNILIHHGKFDISVRNDLDEDILSCLILLYPTLKNATDMESIKTMILNTINIPHYDINTQDGFGRTPLMKACCSCNTIWVINALLSDPTVNVNAVDKQGMSAISSCLAYLNANAVKPFLKHKKLTLTELDRKNLEENIRIFQSLKENN